MYSITCPYISLNQIYNSGQSCRWHYVSENKFVVPHKDKVVLVEQKKDRILFYCPTEEFYETWWDYFDFVSDYLAIHNAMIKTSENIRNTIVNGKDIHVLRQNPWEVLVTSILGDNYSKKIWAIETMSMICGEKKIKTIQGLGKKTFYTFPTPEQIMEKQDELKILKSKRNIVIYVSKCILEQDLNLDLEGYKYDEIFEYLKSFAFPKVVIDKMCLNSYGMKNIFPKSSPVERYFVKKGAKNKNDFIAKYLVPMNLQKYAGVLNQQIMYEFYKKNGGKRWGL